MKAIHGFALFLWFGATGLAAAAGTESARSFVQATILGANPASSTLTFLDASGRQRVERATGEAVGALSAVRPGDQAILSLSTEAGRSVVTRVRVHRAEPPAAAAGASATTATAPGTSWPLRRSWPNPYAKGTRPPTERP
jgi:hypothetical protein